MLKALLARSARRTSRACVSLQNIIFVQHLAVGWAAAGTRKLEGSPSAQGVSSTRISLPQPASTMFFATCTTLCAQEQVCCVHG